MSVDHFDGWYAAMGSDPDAKDELTHRILGLPSEILPTSLRPFAGLLEVRDDPTSTARRVRRVLRPGGRLVITAWEARPDAGNHIPVPASRT